MNRTAILLINVGILRLLILIFVIVIIVAGRIGIAICFAHFSYCDAFPWLVQVRLTV